MGIILSYNQYITVGEKITKKGLLLYLCVFII